MWASEVIDKIDNATHLVFLKKLLIRRNPESCASEHRKNTMKNALIEQINHVIDSNNKKLVLLALLSDKHRTWNENKNLVLFDFQIIPRFAFNSHMYNIFL